MCKDDKMREKTENTIRCSKCGKLFPITIHALVDWENNPEAVNTIENLSFNRAVCPHCKNDEGGFTAICFSGSGNWLVVYDPKHSVTESILETIRNSFPNFESCRARLVPDNISLLESCMIFEHDWNESMPTALRLAKLKDGSWEKPMYLVDAIPEGHMFCFIPADDPHGIVLPEDKIRETVSGYNIAELPTGEFLTPEDISAIVTGGAVSAPRSPKKNAEVPAADTRNAYPQDEPKAVDHAAETGRKTLTSLERFEKGRSLLAGAADSSAKNRAMNLFTEAFYLGYPDDALACEAPKLGAEFQYLLARLYLNWDYRRVNLKLAMKFAKMASDNGRKHADELYRTLKKQLG